MAIKGNKRRMATIYGQYLNGHSYIAPNDVALYEKAYKEIKNK